MKRFAPAAALLALALLTQCHHDEPTPRPEDQLPPATQTGAHTFGCLLNGQPWTPSGNYGPPNYRLIYDPNYGGGNLGIITYRYVEAIKGYERISVSGFNIARPGTYYFSNPGPGLSAYYSSGTAGNCGEYNYNTASSKGQLTITRLDQVAGIVSGTFDFTLWQPGCDTVKVSKGRFDYTL